MVIIGGWLGKSQVTAYNLEGHFPDQQIPPLKTGRSDHACGGYNSNEGKRVRVDQKMILLLNNNVSTFQVLIVVGGLDKRGQVISSSEVHIIGNWKWDLLTSPLTVQGLKGATVANMFYVTGGMQVLFS